jgi:hypothetical protein
METSKPKEKKIGSTILPRTIILLMQMMKNNIGNQKAMKAHE